MPAANESIRVIVNPISTQFEAVRGAEAVGVLAYELEGKHFDLRHTFVPRSHRGNAIAGSLVTGALDAIRHAGGTITPSCTFVDTFVRRHPEYADLLGEAPRPPADGPVAEPATLPEISDRSAADLVSVQIDQIVSNRLVLRPWTLGDIDRALVVYRDPEVVTWAQPPVELVTDASSMRRLVGSWITEADRLPHPQGRWAIELADSGVLVGGTALLNVTLDGVDLLAMSWELASSVVGHGLAAEAGHVLLQYAFRLSSTHAVHAVVQRSNERAVATLQRLGMVLLTRGHVVDGVEVDLYAIDRTDLDRGAAALRSLSLTD